MSGIVRASRNLSASVLEHSLPCWPIGSSRSGVGSSNTLKINVF